MQAMISNESISQWPVFHGPMILPGTFKASWCMKMIAYGKSQYNPTYDIILKICHHDFCFMVQWFCILP